MRRDANWGGRDDRRGRDDGRGRVLVGVLVGSAAACAQAFAVTECASGFVCLPDCSPAP